MAIPSSGAISLSTIQTEFGGANPISLNEYYAGGTYVPAGTSGTYGAVPSSGTISIQNFYGTSNVVISITNQSIADATTDPIIPRATYRLSSNGKVYQGTVPGGFTELETWCTPTSQASNYEVLATIVSGSLTSGTTGSWLALSTTRDWYLEEYMIENTSVCTFTVQIRRIGTATVLDTATIDLAATLFS